MREQESVNGAKMRVAIVGMTQEVSLSFVVICKLATVPERLVAAVGGAGRPSKPGTVIF